MKSRKYVLQKTQTRKDPRMLNFRSNRNLALIAALAIAAAPRMAAAQQGVLEVQIVADKMCCKGCAQKVAAQLYALPGVTSVDADVPNRLVTVTAKPSPKLTPDRLWRAAEQGKGGPSKLVTPRAAYVLTRAENLKPEQRYSAGHYSLEVRSLQDNEAVQTIANQLYAVRGVEHVSIDANRRLLIQSKKDASLSPWALAGAAEQARGDLIAIGGPHGVLTIERLADQQTATAARSTYPQVQGGIR